MQKLHNRFSQNSVERWHTGPGRNDSLLLASRYVRVRVMATGRWKLPHDTGSVLRGIRSTVTILRDQQPWLSEVCALVSAFLVYLFMITP